MVSSTGRPMIQPTNEYVEKAFLNLADLQIAVNGYISDPNCATDSTSCDVGVEYGWPINTWCVGAVTSFYEVFLRQSFFNEDISSWQTGQVSSVSCTIMHNYTAVLSFPFGV